MKQTFLDNQTIILICLILSVFRIYLEVIQFDFAKLPITKSLPKDKAYNLHKMGFYLSVGYFLLFAPEYLFSS
jgi:hypothetical protein